MYEIVVDFCLLWRPREWKEINVNDISEEILGSWLHVRYVKRRNLNYS